MQILRFEDAPEVAPKRKKSSAGWIGLGLVAALFGVSTAFANSTIGINTDNTINLAQGVVEVIAPCDPTIGVALESKLKADLANFYLDRIVMTGLTAGACGDKDFKISFYRAPSTTPLTCAELLGDDFGGKTVSDTNRDAAFALLSLSHEPTAATTSPIECEGSSIYFKMDDEDNMILNLPTITVGGNQEFVSGEYFSHITLETTTHF
jgi:hypothetical protein